MKEKGLLLLPLLLVLALLLAEPAAAAELEAETRRACSADALEQGIPAEASEVFGALTIEDAAEPSEQLEAFWTFLTGSTQDIFFSALRNAALLLLLVFLTSFCSAVTQDSACFEVTQLTGAAAVSALSVQHAGSCISIGCSALWTLSDFSKILLPSLCAAASASGSFTAAGAKYAATVLFMDVLITVETKLLLPMLYTYTGLMVCGTTMRNDALLSVAKLLKRIIRLALVAVATGFTLYLTVTGVLTGTADDTAVRAARTTMSAALPVVGRILSNAASTVLSGAAMLRNGIGVFGLLCVLAVCAVPYLTLGVHYLFYRLAAGISGTFAEPRLGKVIDGFGDLYALLLGMTGTASLILFLSILSSMKAVTPV